MSFKGHSFFGRYGLCFSWKFAVRFKDKSGIAENVNSQSILNFLEVSRGDLLR
jgi:hypothetical protein